MGLDWIQTHPSFYSCPSYLQEWILSIIKWKHLSGHNNSPIISLWGFFKTLKGSSLLSPKSGLAKFWTHLSFYSWPCYLQEWARSNQKWRRQSGHNNIHQFLRWSRRANSIIGDGILTKFKLIQAFIVVLVICKNKEDPFKIESTRVVTTFLPLLVYGDFSRYSRAANS